MNDRICTVRGCGRACGPRTYSPLCQAHRVTRVRHGHPEQRAVTFYEMAPHMAAIRAVVKRNPDSEVWSILAARWERLRGLARGIVEESETGQPFHRPTQQAAVMLLAVSAVADPLKMREVMLSLYLMRQGAPYRFRDDQAFAFTLVRRFRHLAPMSLGSYWNDKLRKTSTVYREAPSRAVVVLGAWLGEVFGLAGVLVAEDLRKRELLAATEGSRMAAALGSLG